MYVFCNRWISCIQLQVKYSCLLKINLKYFTQNYFTDLQVNGGGSSSSSSSRSNNNNNKEYVKGIVLARYGFALH